MKLDPRIEKDTLIYTPFSNAQINLHVKGYFTDNIVNFANLEECVYGELVEHDINLVYPYRRKDVTSFDYYPFYIPESSLKSK